MGDEQDQNNGESQGHPAWQSILDKLPDDLHSLIIPELENWDKGVQQKLQDVRSQYDPYEPIVKNKIPIENIEGALYLAQMFETNPADVVKRAIEQFDLDYAPKSAVPSPVEDDDDYEDDMSGLDLENHPAFKAMMEKVEAANNVLTERQQREAEEAQAVELEQYLETLHGTHGEFDDLYVNALMANGVEAEQAITLYKDTVAKAVQAAMGSTTKTQQTTPPVVLGGDGHTGSGIPNDPVPMGMLNKNSLNDVVMQFLEQNDSNKT